MCEKNSERKVNESCNFLIVPKNSYEKANERLKFDVTFFLTTILYVLFLSKVFKQRSEEMKMNESKRTNGVLLAANVIHGVWEIDPCDLIESDIILPPVAFYESLPYLDDDTIITFVNGDVEHIYNSIESEYGIN